MLKHSLQPMRVPRRWHKRLGHHHVNGIKGLQSMVVDVNLGKGASQIFPCEGSVEGKQARASFPSDGGMRATQVLELVHSDVCGPMKILSFGGARYFVTFIDDFSRKMWMYILKSKHQVLNKFEK